MHVESESCSAIRWLSLLGELARRFQRSRKRREGADILDQYYVAIRYPNGLPGGVPFEAFGQAQANAALAERHNL